MPANAVEQLGTDKRKGGAAIASLFIGGVITLANGIGMLIVPWQDPDQSYRFCHLTWANWYGCAKGLSQALPIVLISAGLLMLFLLFRGRR